MERWNLYDITDIGDLFILFFTVMLMVLARMDFKFLFNVIDSY